MAEDSCCDWYQVKKAFAYHIVPTHQLIMKHINILQPMWKNNDIFEIDGYPLVSVCTICSLWPPPGSADSDQIHRRDHPTRNQNTTAVSYLALVQKKEKSMLSVCVGGHLIHCDRIILWKSSNVAETCLATSATCWKIRERKRQRQFWEEQGETLAQWVVASRFHPPLAQSFHPSLESSFRSNECETGGRRESHWAASTFESSE